MSAWLEAIILRLLACLVIVGLVAVVAGAVVIGQYCLIIANKVSQDLMLYLWSLVMGAWGDVLYTVDALWYILSWVILGMPCVIVVG